MSHSHLLDKVVSLIGAQPAIRLVRAKGGQDIGFPYADHLHDLHWLVVLVGHDHAKALCIEFQGASIKLPIEVNALLQLRNKAIAHDFQEGKSVMQIARFYEIDRRLVQKVIDRFGMRGKLRELNPQLELGV